MQILAEALVERMEQDPGQPAIADGSGTWSRGELRAATENAARAFRQQGVSAGDRVLLQDPPSREFAAAAVALLRLGACLVPLRPGATARELEHVLADARPAFACSPAGTGARAAGVPQLPVPRASPPGAAVAWPTLQEQDAALILYTSGTTSKPKGVLHTQRSVLANLLALGQRWNWSAADHLLLCLPFYHLHGLCVGLLGSLVSGMAVTLRARFDAPDVVQRLQQGGITLFYGVPTQYAALVAADLRGPHPDVRALMCGSAPLTPTLRRALHERVEAPLVERYGTTETGIVLSQDLDGGPEGTVGFPLPGCTVSLRDAGGAGLPARGELCVRSASLFFGYWDDPAATAAALGDGSYRTGDLVELRPDGAFRILGRLNSDLFKVRGHKVAALEVEAVLAEHPGVRECAVIAVPHPTDGEELHAFVCPVDPRLDARSLLEHARQRLAPYQVPHAVHLVAELPCIGPGKVDKASLRARMAAP